MVKADSQVVWGHFTNALSAPRICSITGNAHTAYRPGDYTCGVPSTVTGYASCHSLSPENASHLVFAPFLFSIRYGPFK